MAHFFPDAECVSGARRSLGSGHYGDLDQTMGVRHLPRPGEADLTEVLGEFAGLVGELGLRDGSAGFIVLVPVTSRGGGTFTLPVRVDTERTRLSFTSHPEFGAGAIPDEVLESNPGLAAAVRDQLLGVLATWHNADIAESEL